MKVTDAALSGAILCVCVCHCDIFDKAGCWKKFTLVMRDVWVCAHVCVVCVHTHMQVLCSRNTVCLIYIYTVFRFYVHIFVDRIKHGMLTLVSDT